MYARLLLKRPDLFWFNFVNGMVIDDLVLGVARSSTAMAIKMGDMQVPDYREKGFSRPVLFQCIGKWCTIFKMYEYNSIRKEAIY